MPNKTIKNISKEIVPILKKHDVVKASIFGSYARGEQNSKSDIDMMITFKGSKSLLDLVSLQYALKEKVNKDFDVSTYKAIHPAIKKQVFTEQIRIL